MTAAPVPHRPECLPPDPGARPTCRLCGQEASGWRHAVPVPRKATP